MHSKTVGVNNIFEAKSLEDTQSTKVTMLNLHDPRLHNIVTSTREHQSKVGSSDREHKLQLETDCSDIQFSNIVDRV